MYSLKKEFADATISVGKYRLNITKENVKDAFVQKIISETKGIQHMFEFSVLNPVKSEPEPKAPSSRANDKNEA